MRFNARHPLSLLGAAAAIAAAVPVSALAQAPVPENVVSLSASATKDVMRDLLTITMAVTKEGPDSAAVQAQLKQVLDAALAEARRSAQPGALEVRTGNFSLYPRHNNQGRIAGWQGSAELVLEGKDTPRVAQVAGRLQGLNITSTGFSLSRELREQHEADVTAAAVEKFRARALDVAKGFGFTGYGLREIQVQAADQGYVPMPRVAMMAKAEAASDAPVPVEAGKGSLTVTVSGSIQLRK